MRPYMLAAFLCLLAFVSFGQQNAAVFNRMFISNDSSEIMLIKIKGTDYWVTPGLYQTDGQTLKQGMDSISSSYGIKTTTPLLRGVFSLRRHLSNGVHFSLRNMFVMRISEYKPKVPPANVQEIIWLKPEEAMGKLSFPHITEMLRVITEKPDQIWAGGLTQHRNPDGQWQTKIIEPFYPMQ